MLAADNAIRRRAAMLWLCGQVGKYLAEAGAVRQSFAVTIDGQSRTLVVMRARTVPDNSERMVVVANAVETEPLPCSRRQQRIDIERIVGPRA